MEVDTVMKESNGSDYLIKNSMLRWIYETKGKSDVPKCMQRVCNCQPYFLTLQKLHVNFLWEAGMYGKPAHQ